MLNKLKLGLAALLLPLIAFAQSYPSPTFNNLTVQGTFTASGKVGLASLAAQAANTVVANVTASSGSPTAVVLPSCSTANSALQYTSGTGFSCVTNSAITSGTLAQFAATTSAQLAGVISDETGSGALVFANSPALAGTPTAPTASPGTNTTQLATTAFVQAAATSGRLVGVQIFTSSGTYTPTTGTNSVIVAAVGGGGGGGGAAATSSGQSAAGGGGGAGAFALVRISSGFSGATVTIGAAGSAASAGANAGGTGGTTSFGTFVSCPGGVGGSAGNVAGGTFIGGPSAGGGAPTVTGATTVFSSGGAPGGQQIVITPGSIQTSGTGASGPYGSGGAAVVATSSGLPATGKGAGGSGGVATASTSAIAGSFGAAGLIIVYEYS